jgi:plastocyanin
MRRRLTLPALAVLAALVPAGTALAADATVHAVDGTAANGYQNLWNPDGVSVEVGDTVTWSFAGTQAVHNVASDSDNWQLASEPGVARAPVSHVFTTPGIYTFVCQIHPTTMRGTVVVSEPGEEPPTEPPPDTGPEPWPNPTQAPDWSVRRDSERPRLTRVRARSRRNGATVRFRVSERARVTVRLVRRGRTVRLVRHGRTVRRARHWYRAGTHRMRVRSRRWRSGRYLVVVTARDGAGNRARPRLRRLVVLRF